MTSESRGHCDNIKIFNQGKSNQIREKSGNLIAKNVWLPFIIQFALELYLPVNAEDDWTHVSYRTIGPLFIFRLSEASGLLVRQTIYCSKASSI